MFKKTLFNMNKYLVVLLVSLCTSDSTKTCKPKDACSCTMDTGEEYSLWPIDDPKKPRFQDVPGYSSFTYDYSPCTPINNGSCINDLICQKYDGAGLKYSIGTPDTFKTEFVEGALEFRYRGPGTLPRHGRVILRCDKNATTSNISKPVETITANGSVYTFTLTSKYACPKPGSKTTQRTTNANTGKPTKPMPTTAARTRQPPTEISTSSLPCPSSFHRVKDEASVIVGLVVCITVLLLIQMTTYVVIGIVWYNKYHRKEEALFSHKTLVNLEQTAEEVGTPKDCSKR